jgi:hypothetical protein
MKRLLMLTLLLALALPLAAQEATETPAPEATAEATAEPTPSPYAWCGYLLLERVAVDETALAFLAALFPAPDSGAPPSALMQWRARPDGLAGILEGCHLQPPDRWRVVSALQQGTGMTYDQMDETLILVQYPNVDSVIAFLDNHAAEWEAPVETPTADPAG